MTLSSIKSVFSKAIPFLIIPLIVISGAFVFRDRSYSYIIMATALFTLILFACGFEQKKTGTRRLVLCAAFIAIASIGRVICSPLPGVNPVTAITVLAA